MPRTLLAALAAVSLLTLPVGAQTGRQSTLAGVVVSEDGQPVEAARVRLARTDGALTREGLTDERGTFTLAGLPPGAYTLSVLRLGYRSAELPALRIAGATSTVRVTLTRAPAQLSTVVVESSPTAVDAATPELPARFEAATTSLLPTARTASSLTALVPGARGEQLWGAASGATNDFRVDGVSVSHPGLGGDLLVPSIDWIEALDVRGPAAGAEYGGFQGGIVDAITKTGSNRRRGAMRASYESPRLTATNLDLNEQGAEQAGRREIAGELLGPIARDRLFYFVAGQLVQRDVRAPDLATTAPRDFLAVREAHRDARALLKLTWLPVAGDRIDVLAGTSSARVEHAGMNGVDDPTATVAVAAPTTFYEAAWSTARSARSALDVRMAGFTAHETKLGYAGPAVPAVQLLRPGRQPTYGNAAFDERRSPSSISGSARWQTWRHALGAEHRVVVGGELVRGAWRDTRTRNGGVSWRPFAAGNTGIDPADATTWTTTGSDWGGEARLDARVASDAAFVQDYLSIGTRLTVAPGLRYGVWRGWLTPAAGGGGADRFMAVRARALDPRIGAAWDVTGRSDFAVKAHWGRYHQSMLGLFFDRAAGADVYSNHRFYYSAPPLTDARTTFTIAERDSLTGAGGFSTFHDEDVLDEAGRVERYRQPYVDQAVLGVEKAIGRHWKAEVMYLHRRNHDIVGLVDRNRASNFSVLHDLHVEDRFGFGPVLDAHLQPLVLPDVYIANADIVELLQELAASNRPPVVAGYTLADIPRLRYEPDLVLTAVPEARRRYDQLTLSLRAEHRVWRGEGSVTLARLRGNVAGIAGYGTTGSSFTAGPFVRPNEATNFDGDLPDASELEAKAWATAALPWRLRGGLVVTHVLGERFTPTFVLAGRYRYADSTGGAVPDELFRRVLGQTIFLEPRGSRHYASRTNVDLHLEWRATGAARLVLTGDVFNLTGSNAVVSVKTSATDQALSDPESYLGAPLLRVAPRRLRLGLRVE